MKVISVNISIPTKIEWNGKKEWTGYFKKQVHGPIFLGKTGVAGDHVADLLHHGGKEKACYIYTFDHYDYWKNVARIQDWNYGLFGENITATGWNEADTHIGDIYKIGEAEIQISQPRQPCYKLGIRFNDPEMVNHFRMGVHPGFYVRVLKEGQVNRGDVIERMFHNASSLRLTEVFALIYDKSPSEDHLQQAMQDPLLAPNVKNYLQKKWKM